MPPVYFPQNGSRFEWARARACVRYRRSTHMRSRFSALLVGPDTDSGEEPGFV